jgi:ATPase subunit of ABC transporter with duplicated ATPase domains
VILIDAQGLAARRPHRPLFTDLSLTLNDGDRIGVVGLNGCGKSTLLAMMSGDREPEAGGSARRRRRMARATGRAADRFRGLDVCRPAEKRRETPPAATPVSRKSPSTLRHQLGRADRELAAAIAARDAVQAELVAARADHKELVRLGAELATTQRRVDAAEEHWLSLAAEAESLLMDI